MYFILLILLAILSYIIGSINFSIIVTRMYRNKEDIRNMGSGNAGFTNTLRSAGLAPGIMTFLGDFSKGLIVIWLADHVLRSTGLGNDYIMYGVCISEVICVIGHVYPCFFNFKGGKGVLTAGAMILMVDYRIFLISISIFLIILIITKIMSLSSIIGFIIYPSSTIILSILEGDITHGGYLAKVLTSIIISMIIIYNHKKNIIRLLNGTEKKLSIAKK